MTLGLSNQAAVHHISNLPSPVCVDDIAMSWSWECMYGNIAWTLSHMVNLDFYSSNHEIQRLRISNPMSAQQCRSNLFGGSCLATN